MSRTSAVSIQTPAPVPVRHPAGTGRQVMGTMPVSSLGAAKPLGLASFGRTTPARPVAAAVGNSNKMWKHPATSCIIRRIQDTWTPNSEH